MSLARKTIQDYEEESLSGSTLIEAQAEIARWIERYGAEAFIHGPSFDITYKRPETDVEFNQRVAAMAKAREATKRRDEAKRLKAIKAAAEQETNERETYMRLKEKFEAYERGSKLAKTRTTLEADQAKGLS